MQPKLNLYRWGSPTQRPRGVSRTAHGSQLE